MSRLAKFLWGLASLAVAGVAGYYVLKSERVFNFTFPKTEFGDKLRAGFEDGREWVAGKIGLLTDPVTRKGEEVFDVAVQKGEEVVSGAVSKAKGEVDAAVDKARQSVIDSLRKSLNEKFDDVVGSPSMAMVPVTGSGAVSSQDSLAQFFPLGFSVKRGSPAVFIIKNSASTGASLSYQLFWGDGRSELGSLPVGESKTLFHAWESTGEFLIKIITGSGSDSETHSSYIFVYP